MSNRKTRTNEGRAPRLQLKSIQSKIALLLVASVVLSSTILGVIFIAEISDILRHEAEDDMVLACDRGAETINTKLEKIEEQVKTMQHYAETALQDPSLLQTEEGRVRFLEEFETIAKNHGKSAEGIIVKGIDNCLISFFLGSQTTLVVSGNSFNSLFSLC